MLTPIQAVAAIAVMEELGAKLREKTAPQKAEVSEEKKEEVPCS